MKVPAKCDDCDRTDLPIHVSDKLENKELTITKLCCICHWKTLPDDYIKDYCHPHLIEWGKPTEVFFGKWFPHLLGVLIVGMFTLMLFLSFNLPIAIMTLGLGVLIIYGFFRTRKIWRRVDV